MLTLVMESEPLLVLSDLTFLLTPRRCARMAGEMRPKTRTNRWALLPMPLISDGTLFRNDLYADFHLPPIIRIKFIK